MGLMDLSEFGGAVLYLVRGLVPEDGLGVRGRLRVGEAALVGRLVVDASSVDRLVRLGLGVVSGLPVLHDGLGLLVVVVRGTFVAVVLVALRLLVSGTVVVVTRLGERDDDGQQKQAQRGGDGLHSSITVSRYTPRF